MMLAMKTMVGRTWKAKMKPNEGTSATSLPKTNSEPTFEKSRSRVTPLPSNWKSFLPGAVLRMKSAKANCIPRPQRMTRQRIALRFVDRAMPIPRMARMPKSPMKLCKPAS
ncbi:hypothetical protein D3C86_402070 [compost metagenome]